MLVFPNAKINLGLNITGKRPDGYHNLETVFYPVPLEDALEVTPWEKSGGEKYSFAQYGIKVDGNAEDNLVVKAYKLLDKEYDLPPVQIHLYKHIPMGAGLGGGSSDAAFMLKLLNDMFGLNIPVEKLEEYAASLGADCAFFIRNKPVFAEGIGNIFSSLPLSLEGYTAVIVKPDIFVSTREAFARIKPCPPAHPLREVVARPVCEWREAMINDFEESVFPQYPVIGEIKEELYKEGAVYAAMSGSGSSVFGLFGEGAPVRFCDADNFRHFFVVCPL